MDVQFQSSMIYYTENCLIAMPDTSGASVIFCYMGFLVAILGGFAFSIFHNFLVIYIGVAMIIIGIILGIASEPTRRRENMKIQSVVNIVSVRRQVSISDISAETGLDREYIQEVISNRLISGSLHGYLENDIFVRDVSARRRTDNDSMDSERIMDD